MKNQYRKTVLSNGIKAVSCFMPQKQSVALGVWIKAGGRDESRENKGMAHFLEHMCFKGSRKYSCRRIKQEIEGVGGSLNGFTSEEFTCYLAKLPAKYLGLALDILCDMSQKPALAAEEIKKEKTVILEEIKMYRDLPQSYVHDLLDELLWPGHPLGMSIAGYADSVQKVNRESLRFFQGRYYNPANITIAACGRLEHSRIVGSLNNIFSPKAARQLREPLSVFEKQGKPQLKVLFKPTEQTHLALGFHGLQRDHPLRHALVLMHIILGANMSSRLFEELREKRGLAYEIGTQLKRFQETGSFLVHAGIDNRKVAEALPLILGELAKIKDKAVSAKEFRRAKEFYLGQLSLGLEDTLEHMLWIGESTAALGRFFLPEEIVKEVNKVGPGDISAAARSIFRQESLNLALIGPLKEEEQIYKLLRLN